MPRPRKTELQKAIEKAQQLGIDLSDIALPQTKPNADTIDTPDDIVIEAESVLLYVDTQGAGFKHQVCPVCGREFAYLYKFTMPGMRCSNKCRKVSFERLGIAWNPNRSLKERWGEFTTSIPAVVPPEALRAIQDAKAN